MPLKEKIENKKAEAILYYEFTGDERYKAIIDTLKWMLSELEEEEKKNCNNFQAKE